MFRKLPDVGWLLLALIGLALACGSPKVFEPERMQVVYMPLEGAIDVALDVPPIIVFSDEAVVESLKGSVRLEVAEVKDGSCPPPDPLGSGAKAWSGVDGAAGRPVDDSMKNAVVFTTVICTSGPCHSCLPGETCLLPNKCYRLICTTGLKGKNLGNLKDMGNPLLPGVGAVTTFRTRSL